MTRKTLACLAVATAALALVPISLAGRQGGTIRGRVIDPQGFPVNGAYIYVTSPSQVGIRTFITGESGFFGFLEVDPGLYKVTVEMPGFKTVSVQDMRIESGATVKADFKLEATEVEEEKVARAPAPLVDPVSARLAAVLDHDLLARIPLPRDFSAVLGLVPGLLFEGDAPGPSVSVLGLPTSANEFSADGVNVTDPIAATSLLRFNVDAIDEVEVVSAAHPAGAGAVQGAAVNVVQRSGGNRTSGALSYAFSGSALSRFLWSADELAGFSLAAPVSEVSRHDVSFTWGGPLVQDMVWFFSDVRFVSRTTTVPFKTWTDPLGVTNWEYLFHDRDLSGMFKLSTRLLQKYQGSVEIHFSGIHQPAYAGDLGWNRPISTTRNMDGAGSFLAKAQLAYTLAQGTIADIALGYFNDNQPLLLNTDASGKPQFFDLATGRTFGSGPYNEREARKRLRARASVVSLQDRILGMSHELSLGADYESTNANSSVWKADNLVMYYLNGSPYTFGSVVSPVSGNTVGEGLIGFSVAPQADGALNVRRDATRLGFYVQDLMTIARRATLSLGLRFDRTVASFPFLSKGASGNAIAVTLGDNLINPTYSLNPFDSGGLPAWDDTIVWNSLSPRAGLSIDLLGTGKTFLRGSYSRVPEVLGLGYSRILDPFPVDRIHKFTWYDENGDGLVDEDDNFSLVPFNYNIYQPTEYKQRVDPAMKAPLLEEWTAGIDQQVSRTVSLSARYVSRAEENVVGDVLYDPASGQPWYNAQNSPAGWWIPFATTVPGVDGTPATPVTVYFRSTTAPAEFDRIQNVPELGRKFRGVELTARKRMSDNWQLAGSFVWGRSTGTANLAYPLSMGLSMPVLTPNSLVNITSASRTDLDRPFALRVMGTYRFPLDIYLGLYYRYTSGAPWARTVTVVPPAGWAAANGADATPVTVYLESPGSRRYAARQNTDLRLEKEFLSAGRARFSIYMDVLNLFGNRYEIVDLNDGGFWAPDGVGGTTGVRTTSGTYKQAVGVLGTRAFVFRLSLIF